MPQPRFITSDSQMGAPGVYVKENAPAVPVRGQRNRVVGLVGQCVRGPANKLVECSTYQRFLDVFGGRDRNTNGGDVLGHVWRLLQGKRWGKMYVVRVAASDAVAASFTLELNVATLDIDTVLLAPDTEIAAFDGAAGVTIDFAADGAGVGHFTRVGKALTFHFSNAVTTVTNFEAAVGALVGDDKLIVVGTPGTGSNTFVTADATGGPYPLAVDVGGSTTQVLKVTASSVGSWGNDVGVRVLDASDGSPWHFNLAVRMYGSVKLYENIDISTDKNNINLVIGNSDANVVVLERLAAGRPMNSVPGVHGADSNGYVRLGQTVASHTSVVGTQGTVADADYTGDQGPMELINSARGIHACAVAGRSTEDIKVRAQELAGLSAQRAWYVCPDDAEKDFQDAIDERRTLVGGRLCYVFNHVATTDPVTREVTFEEPYAIILSIISQTDPDVHPGDFDNAVLTRAARGVRWELSDQMRDALDADGVTFVHRDQDQDGNDVVIPGNALTCDNAVNNRDLDGRYMKDFVIDALANRLRGDQFKGNTNANRAARAAACSSFLNDLAQIERYVMKSEEGVPQYQYVNNLSVNTLDDQATGLQKELCIVRLIPKNKIIQLNATIGVDATISEQ